MNRNRLNWSKQLIGIAKEHVKEAKKLFDIERKVTLIDVKIRDLKKDNEKICRSGKK